MRLLIVTQAVDRRDPVLGFFARWVEELARRVEHVTVICLKTGEYALPNNVHVYSLGKEHGRPALGPTTYVWRFLRLVWLVRRDYDTVFVHMNEEYVLIAGWLWNILGKRVYLWRNHAKGSFKTRIAGTFSQKIFYTSPQSYTASFKNAVQMPVGIDTVFFTPDPSVARRPRTILFLGRIAPVKKVREFVDMLGALRERGVEFTATIAGGALPRDASYKRAIHATVHEHGLDGQVRFVGAISQAEARALYRTHHVYVNLTPSGSMDKTIFEAMACGAVPVVYNDALREILDADLVFDTLDAKSGVDVLEHAFAHCPGAFRDVVVAQQSLVLLVKRLIKEFA